MSSPSHAMLEPFRDPPIAAGVLAGMLRAGQISLLLGSGVSNALKLPNWASLVQACETATGVTVGPSSDGSQALMERMDVIRYKVGSQDKFLELVRVGLYPPDLLAAGTYPEDLLTNHLMISLGALVMSSVRGSVADVLTLNFDDALDWYLHLHGFRTQVVQNFPVLLRGDVDVRIHHFHGFLPLTKAYSRSDWLVLTQSQLIERLAQDANSPWATLIAGQMATKMILVVGSSMSDVDVDVFLHRASGAIKGSRPLGFVVDTSFSDARIHKLLDYGMVPVEFSSHDEIPRFLLDICRRASAAA